MNKQSANTTSAPSAANSVWIVHALEGGWDVRTVGDDGIVTVQHCSDWHQVERTRRFAEAARSRRAAARVAAALLSVL